MARKWYAMFKVHRNRRDTMSGFLDHLYRGERLHTTWIPLQVLSWKTRIPTWLSQSVAILVWRGYAVALTEGINGVLARSNEITADRIQNGIEKPNESRVLRSSAKRRSILIISDGFVIFKSPLEEEYFAKHLKNWMDSDCSPGLTINSSDFSRLFTYSFKLGVLSLSIFWVSCHYVIRFWFSCPDGRTPNKVLYTPIKGSTGTRITPPQK